MNDKVIDQDSVSYYHHHHHHHESYLSLLECPVGSDTSTEDGCGLGEVEVIRDMGHMSRLTNL